jgi:hypothetical protein
VQRTLSALEWEWHPLELRTLTDLETSGSSPTNLQSQPRSACAASSVPASTLEGASPSHRSRTGAAPALQPRTSTINAENRRLKVRTRSCQRSARDSIAVVIWYDCERAGSSAPPECYPSPTVNVVMTRKESQDVENGNGRNGEKHKDCQFGNKSASAC